MKKLANYVFGLERFPTRKEYQFFWAEVEPEYKGWVIMALSLALVFCFGFLISYEYQFLFNRAVDLYLSLCFWVISVFGWIHLKNWIVKETPSFLWVKAGFDLEEYLHTKEERQAFKAWAAMEIDSEAAHYLALCLMQEKMVKEKQAVKTQRETFLNSAKNEALSELNPFREKINEFHRHITTLENNLKIYKRRIKKGEERFYVRWRLFEALGMLPETERDEKLPADRVYLNQVRKELEKAQLRLDE